VERALPVSRVALNLAKPKAEIHRGNCLTLPGSPFVCTEEVLARVERLGPGTQAVAEKVPLKNHSEVEIALGTAHALAQIHFLEDQRFARILLRESVPALWNQPFLIIRHGGSEILGRGRIRWFGEVPREERSRLTAILAELPEDAGEADQFRARLRFGGRARAPTEASTPGDTPPGAVRAGDWLFDSSWLAAFSTRVLELATAPAGVAAEEIASKLGVEEEATRSVLARLADQGALSRRHGLFFGGATAERAELPGPTRKLLEAIERAGRVAFEPARGAFSQKDLNTLVRLDLVVPLEGNLYYARAAYETLRAEILAGRKAGDRFRVPAAKERTGLSRKYTLPLLNRMEKDGLLRRDGDERMVLP